MSLASAFQPTAPTDDAAFTEMVQAFLDIALTPDLREACRRTLGVHTEISACRVWHRRLHARGWIAPAWPKAWGGAGWSARQRALFDRACAEADAPILFAGGLRSLGPLLIEMGTPMQRARYLPAILAGDDLWCQGFSEPGAGSDLAAINTRAENAGDVYIVNGAKIWTTGAHIANRMFAIVRTHTGARKQDGLTFLLIDMDTPGITVSPIIDLAGEHDLNEVCFQDVRVPVANRVGAEGDGWAVARRLMQLARSNNSPSALTRRVLRRAAHAMAQAPADAMEGYRRRHALLTIETDAFAALEMASVPAGIVAMDDVTASMLKLTGSELHQRATELALDIEGLGGEAMPALTKYLSTRAATIYSGSSETHRNILFRQIDRR